MFSIDPWRKTEGSKAIGWGTSLFFYWQNFAKKGRNKNSKKILSKFCRKGKIKFQKFKNEGDFEGSQLLEVREKIDKNRQIYIFGL